MKAIFNQIEQEVVVLKFAWDSIDDMVNYSMFTKLRSTEDTDAAVLGERFVTYVDTQNQRPRSPF